MMDLMRLCNKYSIRFINDEIYALSVFENKVDTEVVQNPFTSALAIDRTGLIDPSLVHVVWGASKDFGANGIRLVRIVSQNNALFHAAMTPVVRFSSTSSFTEHVTNNILSDEAWVDAYVKENTRLLADSYKQDTSWAKRNGIEYAAGVNAAFLLWANLGKAYQENHRKKSGGITQEINNLLLDQKVFLASGAEFGAEEPGWFRIVFSQPEDRLDMGLERIMSVIKGPSGSSA